MAPREPAHPCTLALEDGTIFRGIAFGATGTVVGEVVFNTAMTGYQEILTDPSYCGQIVTMTTPHVGNYGVNPEDVESGAPHVRGFVVKAHSSRPSNHRSTGTLAAYLKTHGIVGMDGVDTRALTRKLRRQGSMRGVITTELQSAEACVNAARHAPDMDGADLVREVAPRDPSDWTEGLDPDYAIPRQRPHRSRTIVAIDCGMKRNILRHLVDIGGVVRVVPPTISAEHVLALRPDGLFVSNGPGDPAPVTYAINLLRDLMGHVPTLGICLGHQLLALALGATSFKMKFGHRGANQPVQNLLTGRVEITSQNHGFAIDPDSIRAIGGEPTHVNLNDKTLEGFVHRDRKLLGVQYHPEAGPGPHDASYLFDCFGLMMDAASAPDDRMMIAAQAAQQQRQRQRQRPPQVTGTTGDARREPTDTQRASA